MVALASLAALGCRHDATRETPLVVERPVARPDDLLVEGALWSPDATWRRVQEAMGGGAAFLPAGVGALASAAFDLDPTLGEAIDGRAPVRVVLAGDPGAPSWVIALSLADPRSVLTRRGLAGSRATRATGAITGDLIAVTSPDAGAVGAISERGWLVLGRSEADLVRLAPFVTRVSFTRPQVSESVSFDVPGAALGGALRSRMIAEWQHAKDWMRARDREARARHGGRSPDFGDPDAILADLDAIVQSRCDALSRVSSAHLGIDFDDDGLRAHLAARLAPAVVAAPLASSSPVDVPMRGSALALFVRDDAESSASRARAFEDGISVALGPRLAAGDHERLERAADEWAAAGTDAWSMAWFAPLGLLLDVEAADSPRASLAVHDALDAVARARGLREPLGAWFGVRGVTLGADAAGGARTATFPRADGGRPWSIAWLARTEHLAIAVAPDPVALLEPGPDAGAPEDEDAILAAPLLPRLGRLDGALVLRPARLGWCPEPTRTVTFAWGMREEEARSMRTGEAVLPASALRCLLRYAR